MNEKIVALVEELEPRNTMCASKRDREKLWINLAPHNELARMMKTEYTTGTDSGCEASGLYPHRIAPVLVHIAA